MGHVSGVVYADASEDSPIEGRVVRAYRMDTGALLGSMASSDGETGKPDEYTYVASENGSFTVGAGQKVRYGADTRWYTKTFTSSGTYSCSNAEFGGDPAYATSKSCQLITEYPPLTLGGYAIDCGAYSGEVEVRCSGGDDPLENTLVLRTFPV